MQITVTIPEEKLTDIVRLRVDELFSADGRYRDNAARDMIRRIVDETAEEAITKAREAIAAELPAMATDALRRAQAEAVDAAAKRSLRALGKLYAGFDPTKLTPEHRAWIEGQIVAAAKANGETPKQ